jgi:hypothetical protein
MIAAWLAKAAATTINWATSTHAFLRISDCGRNVDAPKPIKNILDQTRI